MVSLLALAHERACEAELADGSTDLAAGPAGPDRLRDLFMPDKAGIPEVAVDLCHSPSTTSWPRSRAEERSRARWRRGMKTTNPVDAARIELLLTDLRLPAIKLIWPKFAAQSDKEGWPAARFLAALAEHEIADRAAAGSSGTLPKLVCPGKTLASFDFDVVPMVSKAQVMALAAGDSWLEKGANLLLFGPPGAGKSISRQPSASLLSKRVARAVHAHHRSRPAAADRAPRPALEARSPSSTSITC